MPLDVDNIPPERSPFRKLVDAGNAIWFNRGDVASGLALIACGLLMIAFLFGLAILPANDLFTVISLFIVVQGYTIVATLLLTMGLRRLLGPNSRFDQFLARSWQRVFVWIIGSSLIVAGCWLIAVL